MRVLIATDLSDAADVALHDAAAMASTPADTLAVIHVLPEPPFVGALYPDPALDRDKVIARARERLRERVRHVCGRDAEIFAEDGIDYAAIVKRAEGWGADVLVVGSHGKAGIGRVLGGVAEAAVRNAHCSVLVSRRFVGRGWVLAATDRSDPSLPAITAAASEARRRGARLEVVQAVGFIEVEANYLFQLATPSIASTRSVLEDAATDLGHCVAGLHVDATLKVLDRPAAAAVVGEAEALGADLIVVGSRGRTGLARLALGSVAEKVMRTAHCSVLVVRLAASS